MAKINVVLYEPEIPANTGNIARLCVCTGASLYLIGKLGFTLTDKYVKRSGMKKIKNVDLHKVVSMEEMYNEFPNARFFYLTTKSKKKYTDIEFKDGDFLVFGPESRGLPKEYVVQDTAITLPMVEGQRSLNLSNSVAITVYEVIRQIGL